MLPVPVLTIDGPSGSGKGTIGQTVAKSLGWHFLDSGALYRVLAHLAQKQNITAENLDKLQKLAQSFEIQFVPQDGAPPQVIYQGEDISNAIRTETAGEMASRLAPIPQIRQSLLQKQRQFRQLPGLVADGRDMGTVVFPDAAVKIYLTASPEIRAQRRYKQLKDKGFDVNLTRLLDEIRKRDCRDTGRETSPLKPADDAHILDTSDLGIDEVVQRVRELVAEQA